MGHLLKTKNEFKERGDTSYIYKYKLNKACFQHDMDYGNFKYLKKRKDSDKVLRDAKNPKYDEYQRRIASLVYKFF